MPKSYYFQETPMHFIFDNYLILYQRITFCARLTSQSDALDWLQNW
jgi:hypothetical protein